MKFESLCLFDSFKSFILFFNLQIDLAVAVAAVVEVVVVAGVVAAAKVLSINEVDRHVEVLDLVHRIAIGDGTNRFCTTQNKTTKSNQSTQPIFEEKLGIR